MEELEPISPGEILLEEFLKPLSMSPSQLAKDLLVPSARIKDIIHARRGITADMFCRASRPRLP